MKVELLFNTPLWVAAKAIRKCWASEDKSDTTQEIIDGYEITQASGIPTAICEEAGPKDKELIHRVGNKNKHASTLEHLNYSFDIDGISRACLQELARHRHASLSVKSSRYTLKELRDIGEFMDEGKHMFVNTEHNYTNSNGILASEFLVLTGEHAIDYASIYALDNLQHILKKGVSNDVAKYCLPESYKTSLVWTINARSLQNFLSLRTNKAALWEIQQLAHELFKNLPAEHKYLFEEFIDEQT